MASSVHRRRKTPRGVKRVNYSKDLEEISFVATASQSQILDRRTQEKKVLGEEEPVFSREARSSRNADSRLTAKTGRAHTATIVHDLLAQKQTTGNEQQGMTVVNMASANQHQQNVTGSSTTATRHSRAAKQRVNYAEDDSREEASSSIAESSVGEEEMSPKRPRLKNTYTEGPKEARQPHTPKVVIAYDSGLRYAVDADGFKYDDIDSFGDESSSSDDGKVSEWDDSGDEEDDEDNIFDISLREDEGSCCSQQSNDDEEDTAFRVDDGRPRKGKQNSTTDVEDVQDLNNDEANTRPIPSKKKDASSQDTSAPRQATRERLQTIEVERAFLRE
jgi:hypothetical protein